MTKKELAKKILCLEEYTRLYERCNSMITLSKDKEMNIILIDRLNTYYKQISAKRHEIMEEINKLYNTEKNR